MRLAIALVAAIATTGPPATVGSTTATVTGTVDPPGTYHFEYGTSTGYGLRTPDQTTGTEARADLTGLTPDTAYHYRLVSGAVAGADRTFRTLQSGPPGATTGAARSVTPSGAQLTGTVDPNGRATTYHFEYGTTTGYGSRTAEASAGSGQNGTGVSAAVGGLRANTRFHYQLVATNDAGVARGRDRAFTTRRNPRAIIASASPNPAPWSGSTTVTGRVSGSGVGGATVALERQDFPFNRPYYLVGTRRASAGGRFSFSVGPLWAVARLRLTTRTAIVAASPIIEVRNALRVGLRASRLSGGRKRLQGSVSPAVPRGRASLQKRSPSGRWVTVRRAGVTPLRGARSRYRFTVRRAATYRVVVLPRDNFAHVRGTSRELRIRS